MTSRYNDVIIFQNEKLYIESCEVLVPSPLKLLYFHELQIQ